MIRPGIIQYGYDVSDEVLVDPDKIKPVMSFHCCISHIKTIYEGDTVGYGRHFKAEKPTKIATLPVGYADGYARILSRNTDVLIHGKRAPQVGNICMDQCMVDVGSGGVRRWDKAVIFGPENSGALQTARDIAKASGTIPYEILTGISKRVPRVEA